MSTCLILVDIQQRLEDYPNTANVVMSTEKNLHLMVVRQSYLFDYTIIARSTRNLDSNLIDTLVEALKKSILNVAIASPLFLSDESPLCNNIIPLTNEIESSEILALNNRKIRVTNALENTSDTNFFQILENIANLGYRNLVIPIGKSDSSQLRLVKNERLQNNISKSKKNIKILIDARGLPAYYNGTATFIIQFLKGLEKNKEDEFQVLVHKKSFLFHRLSDINLDFRFSIQSQMKFDHGILLNQPFHESTTVYLHERCLTISCIIHDIIAIDIKLSTYQSFVNSFEKAALLFDHMFFISSSSQSIFLDRFAMLADHSVIPLSLMPSDYLVSDTVGSKNGVFKVFIVGNNLPHKNLNHTLEKLIFVFNKENVLFSEMKIDGGGSISKSDISEYYAQSTHVVFPSIYEGFGIPIMEAIAFNCRVFLTDNLHNRFFQTRFPSHVFIYNSITSLIEQIEASRFAGPPSMNEETFWSWSNMTETYVSRIREIVRKNTGGYRRIRELLL